MDAQDAQDKFKLDFPSCSSMLKLFVFFRRRAFTRFHPRREIRGSASRAFFVGCVFLRPIFLFSSGSTLISGAAFAHSLEIEIVDSRRER
jgi:hypothetical protein